MLPGVSQRRVVCPHSRATYASVLPLYASAIRDCLLALEGISLLRHPAMPNPGQLGQCIHAQAENLKCTPPHACPEGCLALHNEHCVLSLQELGSLRRCRVMCSSLLLWVMCCSGPQLLLTMTMMTAWKDWTTLKTYWYAAGFLRLMRQRTAL